MENQNNEVDLVNDLSEVLNELKEIEERSNGCELWRTAAWNGDNAFVCFEQCGGITIEEVMKIMEGKNDAWTAFKQRNVWHDPRKLSCAKGHWKGLFYKVDDSCDPSVKICEYD